VIKPFAMADNDMDQKKLAYFQEITGVKDSSLSHQILDAYGLVPGSSSSPTQIPSSPSVVPVSEPRFVDERSFFERIGDGEQYHASSIEVAGSDGSTFVWRVVTLPITILLGSYNLLYGVVALGFWIAGGVLSSGLGILSTFTFSLAFPFSVGFCYCCTSVVY
jgi:FAS-associated factor 2